MDNNRTPFKTNAKYGMLQGIYWATQCTILQFAVMLYTDRGYDNYTIGIASMLVALTNVIAQPLWGMICDRRPRIKKIFMLGLLVAMATSIVIPFSEHSIFLTVGAMMLICFAFQPLGQVIDAWIMRMNANGYHLNYGVVRSFGSMGYATIGLFYGSLLDHFGMWLMTPCFLIGCTIYCFVVLKTEEPTAEVAKKRSEAAEGEETFSDILKKLLVNKQYLILFFTFMFMMIGLNAAGTFLSVKIRDFGGGNFEYGIMLTFMTVSEMVFLLIFSKIGHRFRPAALMSIGYLSIALKIFMMAFAQNVPMIWLAQIFQGPSFGIMLGGVVSYISQTVDKRSLFTAQTGYGASMGIGCIIGSWLGGVISTAVGIDSMMYILMTLPVVSFLVMFSNNLYLRRESRAQYVSGEETVEELSDPTVPEIVSPEEEAE